MRNTYFQIPALVGFETRVKVAGLLLRGLSIIDARLLRKVLFSRFASSTRDSPVTVNINPLLPPLQGETRQELQTGSRVGKSD